MGKVRRWFALAALLALSVAACAPKPITTLSKFNAAEVAYIHEQGPNTIRGQAFLRQRGGGVVTCAGSEVHLAPAGHYATERIRNIYGTTSRPAQAVARADDGDSEYYRYIRIATCDAQGSFTFRDVADGRYFLITVVQWQVHEYSHEGGALMSPVEVSGGEVAEVIIAP